MNEFRCKNKEECMLIVSELIDKLEEGIQVSIISEYNYDTGKFICYQIVWGNMEDFI